LEHHPDYGLIGTCARIWVGDKESKRNQMFPAQDVLLQYLLLFDNPFVHSSVMIRKSVLDDVGTYTTDPERQPPEDYELWSRIARKYKIANLPQRLMIYREVPGSMSRTGINPFLIKITRFCSENLNWWYCQSKSGLQNNNLPNIDFLELSKFFEQDFTHMKNPINLKRAYSILLIIIDNITENLTYRNLLRKKLQLDLLYTFTNYIIFKVGRQVEGSISYIYYITYTIHRILAAICSRFSGEQRVE
jgi:hypothetical protein